MRWKPKRSNSFILCLTNKQSLFLEIQLIILQYFCSMNSERKTYHTSVSKRTTVQGLLEQLKHPKLELMTKSKSLQPCLDIESIRSKMKKSWKDPGYCNLEFKKPPILKPKMLNEWEYERIFQAERSYKYPKSFKGVKFDQHSREFPQLSNKLFSQAFQNFLKHQEVKKTSQNFYLADTELKLNKKKERIVRMLTETGERAKKRKKTGRDGYFGYTKTISTKLKTMNS